MVISIQMIAYIATANIGTIGVLTVLGASSRIQSTLIDISAGMPVQVQSVTRVAVAYI